MVLTTCLRTVQYPRKIYLDGALDTLVLDSALNIVRLDIIDRPSLTMFQIIRTLAISAANFTRVGTIFRLLSRITSSLSKL
jgi:hypothetical protein